MTTPADRVTVDQLVATLWGDGPALDRLAAGHLAFLVSLAVRDAAAQALAALGLDAPHGFSLVEGRDLLLIWRSEGQWWLLRTAWAASPAPRSQALTTP